ncbi:MAG TPA: hypothetical protein VKB72_13040 [Steroidobacteraceae bacterium]|nr:hypothetical protein [Steroidobacteraceae bacterium]
MRVPGGVAVPALLVMMATACSVPRNATTVVKPDAPLAARAAVATNGTPAAAAAGSGSVQATTNAAAGVDAALVKEGYRVMRRHGQTLYCRSQSVTGTLFASTVCLTASEIASQRRELQESRDLLNQGRATQCVGPECLNK